MQIQFQVMYQQRENMPGSWQKEIADLCEAYTQI